MGYHYTKTMRAIYHASVASMMTHRPALYRVGATGTTAGALVPDAATCHRSGQGLSWLPWIRTTNRRINSALLCR